jgi:hypothetical protein
MTEGEGALEGGIIGRSWEDPYARATAVRNLFVQQAISK